MAWTERDYQRLGDHIVDARVQLGWSREQLASASDVTLRTIADVETGKLRGRKTFSAESLASVSKALGWAAGTWRRILDDAGYSVDAPQAQLDLGDPGVVVGAPSKDADSLLYRRPDGVSDQEWERIRDQSRDYIEWLIDKAARER